MNRFVMLLSLCFLVFTNSEIYGQCTSGYSLSPSSGNYPATSGSASFTVNVPDGCFYYAFAGSCFSWIGSVNPGPTGTVTFFRTANNTCSSRSCSISVTNGSGTQVATFNITQQGLPNASQPGAISGPSTFCEVEPQQYSISPVSNATSYTWSFSGGGTPVSSGTSVEFTPSSSGVLSVVANNNCGSGPPRTLELTLLDLPMAPDSVSGPTEVCLGEETSFSIPSMPGDNTYAWTYEGEEIYNGPGTSITFAPEINGTLAVTASNFCGESPETTLGIEIVTPPNQPGPISGDSIVCINSEPVFTIDAVGGANSYSWSLPPSWSGNSDSTSLQASLGFEGGVLEVEASNECGTSPTTSFEVNIAASEVNPGPISGPDTICAFEETTFYIDTVSGATDYYWEWPDGWDGEQDVDSIGVLTNDQSGDIHVQLSDGCGLSDIESFSVTVDVVPMIPSDIEGEDNVCESALETYSVTNDPNAESYQWILPDSTWVGTSSGPTIDLTVGSNPGTLQVIAMNHCGSSPPQTVELESIALPDSLAPIMGDTVVCADQEIMYFTEPAPDVSYYWTFSGASELDVTTASSQVSVTWIETGLQNITVSATNECATGPANELSVMVNECTSIDELVAKNSCHLYPNPVRDLLNIKCENSEVVDFTSVNILDTSGRLVRTFEGNKIFHSEEAFSISLGDLEPGLYFVQTGDAEGVTILQFMKQ